MTRSIKSPISFQKAAGGCEAAGKAPNSPPSHAGEVVYCSMGSPQRPIPVTGFLSVSGILANQSGTAEADTAVLMVPFRLWSGMTSETEGFLNS